MIIIIVIYNYNYNYYVYLYAHKSSSQWLDFSFAGIQHSPALCGWSNELAQPFPNPFWVPLTSIFPEAWWFRTRFFSSLHQSQVLKCWGSLLPIAQFRSPQMLRIFWIDCCVLLLRLVTVPRDDLMLRARATLMTAQSQVLLGYPWKSLSPFLWKPKGPAQSSEQGCFALDSMLHPSSTYAPLILLVLTCAYTCCIQTITWVT